MVAVADKPGARQVGQELSEGRQARGWALHTGLLPRRPPAAAFRRPSAPRCGGSPDPTLCRLPSLLRSRFLWVSSGEPHAIRRRELLSKYGEQIRKLYGYDHATAYQVRTTNPPADASLSCGVQPAGWGGLTARAAPAAAGTLEGGWGPMAGRSSWHPPHDNRPAGGRSPPRLVMRGSNFRLAATGCLAVGGAAHAL